MNSILKKTLIFFLIFGLNACSYKPIFLEESYDFQIKEVFVTGEEDINKIDLREIENSPCEYFVICSGNSNTQVSSIVNSVRKSVSKILKEKPLHIEGLRIAEWVLIDYVNIVVHVFQKKTRELSPSAKKMVHT